jgi:CBS domain-containing protein
MLIVTLLRSKGDFVATVAPTATVRELLDLLAEQRIGAAVVTREGAIAGIVSERDVVRNLSEHGGGLLDLAVSEIMTAEVVTCRRDATVEDLARTMTERRIRHVPVVDDEGALIGIVSIGDVVKSRIGDLEGERNELVAYITRGG